jgi:hypothetical protein
MQGGILLNPHALWIGMHYSAFNKRVCINLLPMLTIWIAFKGGATPKSWR